MNVSYAPNYSFIFPFEQEFDKTEKRRWMTQHWHTSMYFSLGYLLVIFLLRSYMETRPRMELKRTITIWNAMLASFSLAGLARFGPEFIYSLFHQGFTYSVCEPSYIEDNPVSGFWTWMFALSKVPELGDTLFIVLRKGPLIFLHWYHHITVLVFTWFSYFQHIAPARWYIFMNLLAHSMMYSYYLARSLGKRVPRPLAMLITLSQILQMVGGLTVSVWSIVMLDRGQPCQMNRETAHWAILMYLSYFVLFSHYFYSTYITKTHKKSKAM